ncbi:LysO family transporter [Desulforamulus hydrothermalis]|uniref:DUF340 domain-containing protein n=1 Tax=Desulforamulus hydrothermalis Lam5 = DSM 18033 TaxID=1121428 RepID=K8E0Z2_9FIRM|nr:LysO family transporter [Desulforamulus hydrothermalis]CCO09265.1 conserved membrane hypothetical protein [Desulforamulus hydrothermalis Lam5 = DSM 18033]SHH05323.1 Membrane protein of unknown function [Desulforamulus hydrothermalis Lam5 = DSM 18033]
MIPVLLAVALGILVGHFNLLAVQPKAHERFTTGCLLVMLLAMGAQLGTNEKLLANLTGLGWQALVLAAGAIIGSVALVRPVENYLARLTDRRPAGQ